MLVPLCGASGISGLFSVDECANDWRQAEIA